MAPTYIGNPRLLCHGEDIPPLPDGWEMLEPEGIIALIRRTGQKEPEGLIGEQVFWESPWNQTYALTVDMHAVPFKFAANHPNEQRLYTEQAIPI